MLYWMPVLIFPPPPPPSILWLTLLPYPHTFRDFLIYDIFSFEENNPYENLFIIQKQFMQSYQYLKEFEISIIKGNKQKKKYL